MNWDELVVTVTARYPTVRPGRMFGMPCLKRADGKVVASLWKDGGITVKLVDEAARVEALALPGAAPGSHAFDKGCKLGHRSPGPTHGRTFDLGDVSVDTVLSP